MKSQGKIGNYNEYDNLFIEQYFNNEIFSWLLILSAVGFYTVLNFIIFKALCIYFLQWNENEQGVKQWQVSDLFQELLQSNYIYLLFWYWFTDIGSIFPTSFDFFCYYAIFYWLSLILSCQKTIEKYVKDVIDP
jgi:hypothetical protein